MESILFIGLRILVYIILLTIYAKSEQVDIIAEDIRNIIPEYEQQAIEDSGDE